MLGGWIYIITNRPNGTLYLGVTNNLARRVGEHQAGFGSTFTSRHKLYRLVCAEPHENMASTIQRETSLKQWPRAWKVRLIVTGNPDWDDLSVGLM